MTTRMGTQVSDHEGVESHCANEASLAIETETLGVLSEPRVICFQGTYCGPSHQILSEPYVICLQGICCGPSQVEAGVLLSK
jgi:hypothetical protein